MKRILCASVVLVLSASSLLMGRSSAVATEQFEVDAVHSSVLFRVKHLNVSYFHGRFNDISGKFAFSDDPSACMFDIQIKTDSVDTGNAKREQHLKSPDFFNAKQFPTMGFKSSEVKKSGDNTFDVTGSLTLHGVTKPLSVKLERIGSGKDPWGGYRTGFESVFTIKRSDFGMSTMPDALGDEVRVTVAVEGVRK
ncbi:MAG: YceI family protein [Phycisphaerae bacterium]|nr:YceI family protein [Phycisphaerae bacterium]NUQ45316.1 YceI family protein [Phycisphaerae bacterium]